jgi:short-subunit dehydrogenase
MPKRDLTDRTIIITGASSGIGAATARACAASGMNVVLAARRGEALENVAQELRAAGRRALVVTCDVGRDDEVAQLFSQAVRQFGRIDMVFANAGYALFAPVVDTSDQEARDMFETNFFGTIRCVRLAVEHMRRNPPPGGGHILICSSSMSEIALPMFGFYGATKAAQDSIAGALRAELKRDNIFVTSVHPIGTRTGFFDVVAERSPRRDDGTRPSLNTPELFMQSPEHVARTIVRCLRRPCPEVWPSLITRFAVALATALPRLSAWAQQKIMDNQFGGKR